MKTCQEITENIEKGNIRKLTIRERISIRRHLKMCPDCDHYAKDSVILDRLLSLNFKRVKQYRFTPEEKSALIEKLR